MTLPANLGAYLSAALFVLGAYVAALYLGMIVWTYRDIHSRTRDVLAQILAVLLVAVFTLPGLLVYYLLRPQETLAEEYERSLVEESVLQELGQRHTCPNCQRRVEDDFIVCPYCHEQLRLRCTGCGQLLQPEWDVCPFCGLMRTRQDAEESEPDAVELPTEEQSIAEAQEPEALAENLVTQMESPGNEPTDLFDATQEQEAEADLEDEDDVEDKESWMVTDEETD